MVVYTLTHNKNFSITTSASSRLFHRTSCLFTMLRKGGTSSFNFSTCMRLSESCVSGFWRCSNNPKPDIIFPHVNDTAHYQQTFFPMYVEVKCEVRGLAERGWPKGEFWKPARWRASSRRNLSNNILTTIARERDPAPTGNINVHGLPCHKPFSVLG